MFLFNALAQFGRRLMGMIFPMFRRAGSVRMPKARFGWFWRTLLLVLILVGLWFLNYFLGLERYVRAPLHVLRQFWLPLLFVLIYILFWLGGSLWKLLGPDQIENQFPDIDTAWTEAVDALAQAGINLSEAPLYLILGQPMGGEKSLFNAAELKLLVKQIPRGSDSPLTISANQDAIYINCPGASLLGEHAERLASSGSRSRSSATAATAAPLPAAVQETAVFFELPGESSAESEPADQATAVMVADEDEEPARQSRSSLLRDAEEVERLTARLRYLCQKIARDRRPYCPINGILLLIPFSATDSEVETKETATLIQRDLTNAREALQVQCPIFAVVCDTERALGFGDFLSFYPEGQRRRYLGQQFPLSPDLDASARVRMVERGVQWIGNSLLPSLLYKNWDVESAGRSELWETTNRNTRLYQFLWQIRDRQKRLSRILTRGIVMHSQGPTMLGGCCFAATGRDRAREQGFASAVFRLLNDNQNFVSWTPEALGIEADYRRWTRLGYAALAVLGIGLIVLESYLWFRN